MVKKIVIPIDFSVESLNQLKHFLADSDNEFKFDIILLHGYQIETSITSLLYFSQRQLLNSLESESFKEALAILVNKFSNQIKSIKTAIFSGNNLNAMKNYLEANDIDEIVYSSNYNFKKLNRRSFEITKYLIKSGVKTQIINWENNLFMPEKDTISEIFSTVQINN